MIRLVLALILLAAPAMALDPERREVVVITGRLWDGDRHVEMFLPSASPVLTVMAGQDSAIGFVRTQEYYWPLSRQVYVDFERQRDPVAGVLHIMRDGKTVAEVAAEPYAIDYPAGAVNGGGRLLWGAAAVGGHMAYRQSEHDFNRRFVAAQRGQTAYERSLVEAALAGSTDPVPPPPPLPEPGLRLVTTPVPGFRVALDPGTYRIALVADGVTVPGTERDLRVVATAGKAALVADILPEERWTRPLPSNAAEARIYARAGSTFYVTLIEATRFREADYLAVVSPQSAVPAGRETWVRRRPSDLAELDLQAPPGPQHLVRSGFKVEQTSASGFGYRVRPAKGGEVPDLEAFAVPVPAAGTTRIALTADESGFRRQIVTVGGRNALLSLLLALAPLAAFATATGLRHRQRQG